MSRTAPETTSAPAEPATPSAAAVRPRRWPLWAAVVAIYAVHLALVAYACPREVFFGGEPVMGIDYQTHMEQTQTIEEALRRFGKTWAYDPDLLAGQPAGLFFDVDNKLHCYSAVLLHRLGVPLPVAFNLFVLLVHLLAPLCIWAAARFWGMSPRARLFVFGAAVLIWHFDSAPRWYWWAGMISFALAAHLAMLTLALFRRHLEGGLWRHYLPALITLPLALMAHVWAFAILVVPLSGLYLRHRRNLGRAGHARVWGLALFSLGVNLFWLWPALLHLDLLAPSGRGGQAGPWTLISDYFEFYVDGLIAGTIGTRTLFRFAVLGGALVTLWRWRKAGDERFFAGALTMAWTFGMAYLFALIPIVEETEPYRFILPATLTAAILAGPWLDRVVRLDWVRPLPSRAKVVLVILLVLVFPRVVQTVVYFVPHLSPARTKPVIPQPNIEGPTALTPIDPYFGFRHNGIPDDYRRVGRYLREECPEQGRVLVEWWVLGEYLRWSTDKPIIGGFPDRRMKVEAANIFRYKKDPRQKGQALADYLVRYNVRYLVISFIRPEIEQRKDLFEFKRFIGAHRVYRVRHLGDYVLSGKGKVQAELNRITVSEAEPRAGAQELVLRFHYLDTLRCSPGCRVSRFSLPDNPVGFIKVEGAPTLPRRFVVENGY